MTQWVLGAQLVVFLSWLGAQIGQSGFSLSNTFDRLFSIIVPAVFAIRSVILWSKTHALKISWVCFFANIICAFVYIFTNEPYVAFITDSFVYFVGFSIYMYSKGAITNCIFVGNIRTKLDAQVKLVSNSSMAVGTIIGAFLPPTQEVVGSLIFVMSFIFLGLSQYQLTKMNHWLKEGKVFGTESKN